MRSCPLDPLPLSVIGVTAGLFASASELHAYKPDYGKQWVVFSAFAGLTVVKAAGEFLLLWEKGEAGPNYPADGHTRVPLNYFKNDAIHSMFLLGGGVHTFTAAGLNYSQSRGRQFVAYPDRLLFSWINQTVGGSYDEKLLILESPLGTAVQHLL